MFGAPIGSAKVATRNLLFNDVYTSPFITDNRRFLRPRFGYENVGLDFSIGGFTPGVPVIVSE